MEVTGTEPMPLREEMVGVELVEQVLSGVEMEQTVWAAVVEELV